MSTSGGSGNHHRGRSHHESSHDSSNYGDEQDWWKDYFPHHGTWDDPNEVHGDAQMVNHIPWNAMFPKNSYLPHDNLLKNQHHSYMGNKFHHSHDGHNPKENPAQLRQGSSLEDEGEGRGGDGASIHPEDTLVNHNQANPYGHNTPYLGGMTINEGSKDIFGSVHGNLCVEKRDGICTGNCKQMLIYAQYK